MPRNTVITYDRALREIGSNMIFGAYAAERFKTSDSSCENDAVLKQLFDEYQGNFIVIDVLPFSFISFCLIINHLSDMSIHLFYFSTFSVRGDVCILRRALSK